MSALLDLDPFSARDDARFLEEMNALSTWHLAGCPDYRAVWPRWREAAGIDELPFLHAGVFKQKVWRTGGEGIAHQRTLKSSSTTQTGASMIALDERSSLLQSRSSAAILRELLGAEVRPLVILDHARSLQQRGEVSARITAAMSLRPLASEMHFLLGEPNTATSVQWSRLGEICAHHPRLLVYGFTWMLWTGWAQVDIPAEVRAQLAKTQIHFVHSGGWKKLEAARVDRARFDGALLDTVAPDSAVLDFYGLVEQVGIIYPLCREGFRHVPRWAAAVVRDPWTLEALDETPGMLQLLNSLAHGAPYHSVLTEDLGRLVPGPCPCGLAGQRFELLGRIPKSEIRGCANV